MKFTGSVETYFIKKHSLLKLFVVWPLMQLAPSFISLPQNRWLSEDMAAIHNPVSAHNNNCNSSHYHPTCNMNCPAQCHIHQSSMSLLCMLWMCLHVLIVVLCIVMLCPQKLLEYISCFPINLEVVYICICMFPCLLVTLCRYLSIISYCTQLRPHSDISFCPLALDPS